MTKPPSVLIWFSMTLYLIRGVREMRKHTLTLLSAKWYIFLCNSYLEGEDLWLSSQGFWGSEKTMGSFFPLYSKGELFTHDFLLCPQRNCFSTIELSLPWNITLPPSPKYELLHSTEGRGEHFFGSGGRRSPSPPLPVTARLPLPVLRATGASQGAPLLGRARGRGTGSGRCPCGHGQLACAPSR